MDDEDLNELADTIVRKNILIKLSGKLRNAVRMVSHRGKGGLYKPTDKCSKTGLPAIDVLHARHPNIGVPDFDDADQPQASLDYFMHDDPVAIFLR